MAATVTRWWWIRHAPVTGNKGRIYGQADYACDCSNAESIRALAAVLPADAVWITSNLKRTQQTADAILAAQPQAATPERHIEADLAEQHFGEWQGLTFDELYKLRGEEQFTFWLSPASEVPPGGESFVEVVMRVSRAVQRLTERFAGRQIVAVAHGGSIRAALAHALAIDAERVLSFSVANCSLTQLDHIYDPESEDQDKQGWRVNAVNLLPHPPFVR
ncbi:MAG TPA: histidine phosphatase family protein [Dongiaceae bacterium]|jgi:broad specificity phosphatase PhoE